MASAGAVAFVIVPMRKRAPRPMYLAETLSPTFKGRLFMSKHAGVREETGKAKGKAGGKKEVY